MRFLQEGLSMSDDSLAARILALDEECDVLRKKVGTDEVSPKKIKESTSKKTQKSPKNNKSAFKKRCKSWAIKP